MPLVNNEKLSKYLKSNSVVERFLNEVTDKIESYYKTDLPYLPPLPRIEVDVGSKFIRIVVDGSCWGFISRVDGTLKGSPIRKGDLLKPASRTSPAKHARGNIIDGTAKYGVYGPEYLK